MKKNKQRTEVSAIDTLKTYWREDLKAGFTVSLIALPLCLGIAIASGFPPMAGLISGVIGGILVSRINGSFVTIVGPAAGLIVVNLSSIENLGMGDTYMGYKYTLAAIVIAGVFVYILGKLKFGKLGDFFPYSAVHGMLSAIGIIIMLKQFFVAIGVKPQGKEFIEIVLEIPNALLKANPEVAIIAAISLLIVIIYPYINSKLIKIIPAQIWVLLFAIPIELLLDFKHEHISHLFGKAHKVGPVFLVDLPENILASFSLPDFSKLFSGVFWISVISIALITAIESMLSTIAVDSIDPGRNKSNLNKDISAVGIGTSASGLIGGLPMISEIVRSSANISSGAKSQWSNFFHGIFLCLFILIAGIIIEHIPLSALAALLIYTGFRLASPKEFKQVYDIGKKEFLIYSSTIILVLTTDILIGITGGIILNLLYLLIQNKTLKNLFILKTEEIIQENEVIIKTSGPICFSNYLILKNKILKNIDKASIKIDVSMSNIIDHTVIHHLHEIERERLSDKKEFKLINDEHLNKTSKHVLSERNMRSKQHKAILNTRESEILNLAIIKNYNYTLESLDTLKWQRFPTFKKNRVTRAHNVLEISLNGYQCTIADIEVKRDDIFSSIQKIEITALHIDFKLGIIPSFTLEKEEIFDKIVSKVGWYDINFDTHPEFSKYYSLKGLDVDAIKAYFNTQLLSYLQSNMGYHIESNKKGLLIYLKNKTLQAQEVEKLIQFAHGFLKLWI